MASAGAARSFLRSASASARFAAPRAAAGAKPRAARSPFRLPTQNSVSQRIFRSPVEMSSVSVNSMFPLHSATAAALLNSMLPQTASTWTIEGTMDIS